MKFNLFFKFIKSGFSIYNMDVIQAAQQSQRAQTTKLQQLLRYLEGQ